MRRIIYLLGLVLLTGLMFVSCEKDEDEYGKIKFKLDGQDWSLNGKALGSNEDDNTLDIDIDQYDVKDVSIYMIMRDFDENKVEYSIYDDFYSPCIVGLTIDDERCTSEQGKLTIIDFSEDRIKAEFYFTAKNVDGVTVNVTEGIIDCPYELE